jgi:hypothetical protein
VEESSDRFGLEVIAYFLMGHRYHLFVKKGKRVQD